MQYKLLFPSQGLIGLRLKCSSDVSPEVISQVFENRMVEDAENLLSTAFALPISQPTLKHSFWSALERDRFLLCDKWGNELYCSSDWISRWDSGWLGSSGVSDVFRREDSLPVWLADLFKNPTPFSSLTSHLQGSLPEIVLLFCPHQWTLDMLSWFVRCLVFLCRF
jgi:hypothetical protein